MPDELKKEMQGITSSHAERHITAFQEGAGVPLLKQKNSDAYQPIFTDIIEFGKFNSKNQFKAIAVTADKIPSILVKEAKGVVVNPFGVNLQMPITKRTVRTRKLLHMRMLRRQFRQLRSRSMRLMRAGAEEESGAGNKAEKLKKIMKLRRVRITENSEQDTAEFRNTPGFGSRPAEVG